MEELWDIARVASYLGVTERTVYNKVRAGDLPALKVGRLWRVRPSALREWLDRANAVDAKVNCDAELVAEPRAIPSRTELEALLEPLRDALERRLTFVGLLTRGVEALGWTAPVVVGGHAVEFYTAGGYTTVDIDLAGASEPVAQVLGEWGFRREGRHFYDDMLGLVVEVPGSTPAPQEMAHVVSVRIGTVTARVIGIEDLVIDRLAACKHWHHTESCAWASRLLAVADDLDLEYLQRRAAEEDVADVLGSALEESGQT